MIKSNGDLRCSTCQHTIPRGHYALEGEGGALYCSWECWDKDEGVEEEADE